MKTSKASQALASIDEPHSEKFLKMVDSSNPTGCWPWMGATAPNGYGKFGVNWVTVCAHRVAFKIANGHIDPELEILHSCDKRRCCNPSHMTQGTHAENMADQMAKGRHASGESNGNCKFGDSTIAEVLRLSAEGVFQREIGRRVGMSQPHVSEIVRGVYRRKT